MSEPLRGKLLVANPVLFDPNFHRTVVLLLEHTDDGAVGVVLNRPSETPVAEIVPAWADHATAPAVVFLGGPVIPEGAIGLALPPDAEGAPFEDPTLEDPTLEGPTLEGPTFEGWTPVPNGLGTVDLGEPPDVLSFTPDGLRVFAGHAGWTAGQLEGEIEQGGWFVVDAGPDDAFTRRPDELWREVLRRQRPRVAMYAHHPPDVSMN